LILVPNAKEILMANIRSLSKRWEAFPTVLAVVTMLALAATASAQSQNFSVLYSFSNSPDAANPTSILVRDSEGALYGTTFFGGANACGCGTVFKLSEDGREEVLYSFTGGSDGADPYAGLIRDAAGNLYGTTTSGGDLGCAQPGGCGTVFKLETTGTFSVLHTFTTGSDGEFPYSALLLDSAGNLYGSTVNGGSQSSNFGTVFRLDSRGNESILHRFKGSIDGAFPFGTLVVDSAGNVYGTTSMFGQAGGGTVFRLTADGSLTTMASFAGVAGRSPLAGVFRGQNGNLYGTTGFGGAAGLGTVFVVNRAGKETVLYTFSGGTDGAIPYGGVVLDASGSLYGTTAAGGDDGCGGLGCGTVFRLDTQGNETVLHTFTGGADGGTPYGGLIRDRSGNLYGTAFSGGANGNGVVYRISQVP
jgi:uncharacterized repeat protein (TIGR03803 family)